jgi:hypothetical protein
MDNLKIEIELAKLNGKQDEAYAKLVTRLIRRRYSLSSELALSRQRDAKPEEWEEYDAYCEACKAEAKKEVYG